MTIQKPFLFFFFITFYFLTTFANLWYPKYFALFFPQTSYALYICPQQLNLITTTFLLLVFFFILLFYPSNKDEEVRFFIMIYEICWGSGSFDTYLLWVYSIIIGLWKNRNWKIYKKQSHKQHKNSCSSVLGLCLQATLSGGLTKKIGRLIVA